MKVGMHRYEMARALLVLFALFGALGCNWSDIGRNASDGALTAASRRAPELTHGAVTGARDALAEPETEQALLKLERALLNDAREGAIGEETRIKLQALLDASMTTLQGSANDLEKKLGDKLVARVGQVREEALGKQTQQQADELVAELKERVIGPETGEQLGTLLDATLSNERLGRIRKQLVGQPLRDSVNLLVAGAVSRAANTAGDELRRLHKELDEAGKHLIVVAVVLGVVVILALLLAFWLRRDKRVIRAVTKTIERFDEEAPKKKLKQQISVAQDTAGLEEYFRRILKRNQIPLKPRPHRAA